MIFSRTSRGILNDGKGLLRAGWNIGYRRPASVRHKTTLNLKNLSKNLELCSSPGSRADKPVVLLFGWVAAKRGHLLKYSEHYSNRGYDSLVIPIQPKALLWPPVVKPIVDEIMTTFDHDAIKDRPLLVHAFSAGAYFFGETLVKLQTLEGASADRLRARFVGQILDSPVDFEGIPNGVSKALAKNPLGRTILKQGLRLHLSVFSQQTMKNYRKSSEVFLSNPLKLPSLFLYSLADPITNIPAIERVMEGWEDMGVKVYHKCWEKSTHCSHMYRYPEEYTNEIDSFVDHKLKRK